MTDLNQPRMTALGSSGEKHQYPSGTGVIEVATQSGALGVARGSAAPAEVVEAFKRLHAAWLGASKLSDLNDQMDALATALQLHPLTLAQLNDALCHPADSVGGAQKNL